MSALIPASRPHLLVLDAVEEEDEESLQAVEDGEGVSGADTALVDEQQPDGPGEPEQEHQSHGAADPGAAPHTDSGQRRQTAAEGRHGAEGKQNNSVVAGVN